MVPLAMYLESNASRYDGAIVAVCCIGPLGPSFLLNIMMCSSPACSGIKKKVMHHDMILFDTLLLCW